MARHAYCNSIPRNIFMYDLVWVLLQQSDSLGLVVISEEDTHRTLLIHRIVFEDIYYRQGGMSSTKYISVRVGCVGRFHERGLCAGLSVCCTCRGHHHHVVRS